MALSQQDVRDIACAAGECPHVISYRSCYLLGRRVGLTINEAIIATAIARAESGLNTGIAGDLSLQGQVAPNGQHWGPSVGLWQIRTINEERGKGTSRDIRRCVTALGNARSMYSISSGGSKWTAWSVYNSGAYKNYLDEAREAAPTGVGTDGGDEADVLDTLLQPIRNLIQEVIAAVRNTVDKLLGGVADGLEDVIGAITKGLTKLIGDLSKGLAATVTKVADELGRVVGKIASSLGGIIDKVSAGIGSALAKMADSLASLADKIAGAVGKAVEAIAERLGDIVDKITSTVSALVKKAAQVVADVAKAVLDAVGPPLEAAAQALADVIEAVKGGVDQLLADAATGVGALVEAASGLPAAFVGAATDIVEGLQETFAETAEGLGKFLADPGAAILGAFFGEEAPELVDRIEGLIAKIEQNPATPPEVRSLTRPGALPAVPIFGLIVAIALPTILGGVITTVLQPVLAKMVQEENVAVRPTLLTLGDAVNAYHRGERDEGYIASVGARQGYTDEDMGLAVELARPLPPVGDVLEWRRREIVTDAAARQELARQGWEPATVERLVKASALLPPLQDLVRFAVREAFPGQSAYEGSAGSGVPGRFAELAEQLGLAAEFARSYWAAHWELPSPLQGFEMYHRGVITEQQLKGLLVALDVMPEWRDRLTAIAYNPLTRVDVRRMYALGVLDRAGVVRAHLQLGYSPADADRLAEFVVRSGADDDDELARPERDLTRTDLVGAYADGLLTRKDALDGLVTIGYDQDEAELFLARADLAAERTRRAEVRKQVTDLVLAGVITLEVAQDRLAAAQLTTEEVALTLDSIGDKLAARVAMPTRSDLFRFHKAKIIEDEDLAKGLTTLGYIEPWLSYYVELAKKGQAPIAEEKAS